MYLLPFIIYLFTKHLLFQCNYNRVIWDHVKKFTQNRSGIIAHFSATEIILGISDSADLNLFSIVNRAIKQYMYHDDVIKWKHFPRYWPFVRGIHRSPVNSLHKGQWRGALMFSLICVWINGWVNNLEAGDLRRYCAHYDVSVMCLPLYGNTTFSMGSNRKDLYHRRNGIQHPW